MEKQFNMQSGRQIRGRNRSLLYRAYGFCGLILFLVSLLPGAMAAQERKNFKPEIDGVTVYPDRVLVNRSATVELNPGKQVLVFESASPNLDPASLRGFCDDSTVVVQTVSSYVERRGVTLNAAVRDLEGELKDLQKERSRQQALVQRAKRDLTSLQQ